nr:ATP-binding cassette domain-containing protein [Klebsiella pneumoniae]
MPLITINQMQKYYGDNHVLKGVDLDIDMGEVISIIGRSGSGKSTLLRCINGLEGYQEGSIKLGGMTITNRDSQAREISRSIGMVFQNFNLFPHMTALENVMLAPRRVLKKSQAEGRARRPSGLLPGQPLRRPTAARGHCPGAGHVAESFTL